MMYSSDPIQWQWNVIAGKLVGGNQAWLQRDRQTDRETDKFSDNGQNNPPNQPRSSETILADKTNPASAMHSQH